MRDAVRTSGAPAAIGPYSQAVKAGGFIFVSGQIPIDPATGQMLQADIAAQTHRVITNLREILTAGGSSLDKVVRSTVFLADMGDFAAMKAAERRPRRNRRHRPALARLLIGSRAPHPRPRRHCAAT